MPFPNASTNGSTSVFLPAYGEYDLNPRAMKVAECIIAAGTTDGVATAASDSGVGVDFFTDTQEDWFIFAAPNGGVWVRDIVHAVQVAYTASVSITIGDTVSTAGWAEAVNVGATSTGLRRVNLDSDAMDTGAPYRLAGGKWLEFDSDTNTGVELDIAGADPAVGRMAVYAMYFAVDYLA